MATVSERLRAEGMEKGMQQGMQKGMQQGEVAALRKLIALKFEVLPNGVEETIQNASPADIEGWLERVLTADSLEKLFE